MLHLEIVFFQKPDSDTAGIIFYEEKKKTWIIHVLYFGNPFESVLKRVSSSTKVKLRRVSDGITIGATTYHFISNYYQRFYFQTTKHNHNRIH